MSRRRSIALPVLLLGGRSGENADVSTQMRYEAWATGLDMLHAQPGVRRRRAPCSPSTTT